MIEPAPQEYLNQLICGYWNSQCVYVAARLGIADMLADGPRSIDDLAARTATHAPSLFRVLRALASLGIFAEEPGKRFRLTPAAELLRSDVAGSSRALAIMMGEEYYRAWGELLYSVRHREARFRYHLWAASVRVLVGASAAVRELRQGHGTSARP